MNADTSFVEFDCEYRPNVAGGMLGQFAAEIYPLRVDFYGTHQLGHNGCVPHTSRQTAIFQSAVDSHRFKVRVRLHETAANDTRCKGLYLPLYEAGAYDKTIDVAMPTSPSKSGVTLVAASTSIMLVFYATTFTTLKQQCWTNVGIAVVPLSLLISMQEERAGKRVCEVIHNRDNDVENNKQPNPPKKGTVVVSQAVVRGLALRAMTEFDTHAENSNKQAIASQIGKLINRGMAAFFADKRTDDSQTQFLGAPTKRFLQPYHVPKFASARFELPSGVYSTLRCKLPPSIECHENFLNVALNRSGATRAEALTWSGFLESPRTAVNTATVEAYAFLSICARHVTVFPISQRYLDDVLNRNQKGKTWRDDLVEPDEDFKICRLCGADDCEGVCLETMMLTCELTDASDEEQRQMSPLLQRVATCLRLFVPLMTLGCVTNRKATAAPLDESNALAHTFCTLMPFWQFYNQMHEKQRALLLKSRHYRKHKVLLDSFRGQGKETFFTSVIGEATAPIDPAMRPVETYYLNSSNATDRQMLPTAIRVARDRRELADAMITILDRYNLAEVLQPEMLGPPDQRSAIRSKRDYSQFYKFFMSCSTPSFADLRRLDFAFALSVNDDDDRTYGVPFDQIIDAEYTSVSEHADEGKRHKDAGLMSYLEMTEHDAQLCDAVALDLPPVPVLTLAPAVSLDSERIRQWSKILDSFRKTTASGSTHASDTPLHRRLQYLSIAERDINASVIDALRQISRLSQAVAFDYEWFGVNAALDGTCEHNIILDVYLKF